MEIIAASCLRRSYLTNMISAGRNNTWDCSEMYLLNIIAKMIISDTSSENDKWFTEHFPVEIQA